ncbi:hypothetical protein PIB30_089064 [Stylosanthes scabra]|uniref:Uncharacterized protein n=1 Tax=Stylosanthes scabra TaxID=79078 RepID=A0ABU6ZSK2_9FABA|nr:hypothetical protein [Stylosanthes scabra]
MASSSTPASVFDDYRFRTEFNQTLFVSIVRKKKVTPEVGFNLDEDEYPQIKEQIALRGWRRLAAPITDISKLLVQEFYARAAWERKVRLSKHNLQIVQGCKGANEGIQENLANSTRKANHG